MTTTTEYLVSGMTCAHCVDAVTEEVGALTGVTAVAVDLGTGVLTVTSEVDVPLAEVQHAVAEAGYTLATR
jgi:copper chaperone CopZ